MKTRVETIVTINLAWNPIHGESEIDVILPENTSDYMVSSYDGYETLYAIVNGSILEYDPYDKKFEKAGLISSNQNSELMKKCVKSI